MNDDVKLTWFPGHTNWVKGTVGDYGFQAKLYDEDSPFGINGGRVSKLFIDDEVGYDRGWDFGEHSSLVPKVVDFLEQTSKRFENEKGW